MFVISFARFKISFFSSYLSRKSQRMIVVWSYFGLSFLRLIGKKWDAVFLGFCFLTKPLPIEQFTLPYSCWGEPVLHIIPLIAVASLSNKVSCCCCIPRHGHGSLSLLLSSWITVSLQLLVFYCRSQFCLEARETCCDPLKLGICCTALMAYGFFSVIFP